MDNKCNAVYIFIQFGILYMINACCNSRKDNLLLEN